jgi:hypothetical protein
MESEFPERFDLYQVTITEETPCSSSGNVADNNIIDICSIERFQVLTKDQWRNSSASFLVHDGVDAKMLLRNSIIRDNPIAGLPLAMGIRKRRERTSCCLCQSEAPVRGREECLVET